MADSASAGLRLLDAAQVAELLAVPKSWVYAEARANRIPFVQLGRYRRFREDDILGWLEQISRGPTPYRKHSPGSGPGGSSHG